LYALNKDLRKEQKSGGELSRERENGTKKITRAHSIL